MNRTPACLFRLEKPARLVASSRTHYRGKRQTLEAILLSGQVQLLTDVNRFTWLWQIAYPHKDEPALPAGTVLHDGLSRQLGRQQGEPGPERLWAGAAGRSTMNIGWLDFYYVSDQVRRLAAEERAARQYANTQQQQQ
jgi:hypothetical protein